MNFGSSSPLGNALSYPKARPQYDLNLIRNKFIPPEYTFTRNSAGTYVGADGLIKTAAANEPRFDYDPIIGEFKGLLVEESRTNIATYSEDFANAIWNKQNGFSITSNTATAPDGTLTADTASRNLTIQYLYQDINHSPGTYTLSCWVRSVTGTAQFLMNMFNVTDGSQPSQTFTATTSWQRFSHIGTMTATATGFYPCIPAVSNELYIWGAQVEVGAFPTSYIPTSGSTVTRQPDQLILNKPLNLNGTFYFESSIANLKDQQTLLTADNGTESITITADNNSLKSTVSNDTLSHGNIDTSSTKRALYYNTNRILLMSSSNTETPTLNSRVTPPTNLNRVTIGSNPLISGNQINGYLKKFSYYASPLTEDNVRALANNSLRTIDYIYIDADAFDYIRRVELADGEPLEDAVKIAITNFISGCKTDGIWDAIKASCILAGARTVNGALQPLVGLAPTNYNFVNSDYNRKTGLVSDGTKYLDSNRTNDADPQNDKHSAAFLVPSGITGFLVCGQVFANGNDYLDINGTTLRSQSRPVGSTQYTQPNFINQSNSLVGQSRSNSSGYQLRSNKNTIFVSSTSAVPANNRQLIFARIQTPVLLSAARIAFYSIGESLDLELLDNRVTDLITAFSVALP